MKNNINIRRGAAWLIAGSSGTQILTFAFGIILARLLAPEDFGMLTTIQIFTGLAGFVAGGGMGQALVRANTAGKDDFDVVFTLQFIIGCLIFSLFFFSAPWFAVWYGNPIYSDLLRLSAVTFLTRPFVNLPTSILSRHMRFKAQTAVGLSALLVASAVSITLAYLGHGVWSLVLGGLVGSVVRMVLLIPLADWRPGFSMEWRKGRDLARYGMLTTVGDFIVYLRSQASSFILSRTLGPMVLGLFNKASSLVQIPNTQITGSVYQVTFRLLAKEQDNLDISRYIFLRSITLVSVYVWPVFLSLAWLALPLVRFVYGAKWVGAAEPLALLALVGPFIMMEILSGSVLGARNWLGREIPVQITQLIVVVLGAVAGLPYGLLGVAAGASLANIYGALHMSWLASRCLAMPVSRILLAMTAPFLLNLAVLALWYGIDLAFEPARHLGDFLYLAVMLGSGVGLYALLFFLAPIPHLASEKERWLNMARQARQGLKDKFA